MNDATRKRQPMIAKWSEVVCDHCGVGCHAMPTAEESRQCAKEDGWIRRRITRLGAEDVATTHLLDLCPRCVT